MARTSRINSDELVLVADVADHYTIATFHNVILVYWASEATLAAVLRINEACDRLLAGHAKGFSAVHVVKANAGLPAQEVRKAFTASLRHYALHMGCMAVVLPGHGFWASALQSIITGIRMLSPMGDMVFRITGEVASLKTWYVAEHLARTGKPIGEELLFRHLAELQRTAEAPRPEP